jgi:hypothetical protein
MKLFGRPLGTYCADVRIGVILLGVLAVIRFLMLPVFGVPFAQGTLYTSLNILLLILAVYYAYSVGQRPGTGYRDILGLAFALAISLNVFVSIGIAVDDFGGIETYYTDLAHGGELNPILHIAGHLVGATLAHTLLAWSVGSLVFLVSGRKA